MGRESSMQKQEPKLQSEGRASNGSVLKDIFYLFLKIAVIIVIFILLFTFMFGIHRNRDPSMQPAIKDGDVVISYRLDKKYAAGDCAVVKYEGETQFRRVIAVKGDTVDFTEEGLTINGALQQEASIYEDTLPYKDGITFPVKLKDGEIFVLGDSRGNATDSRIYGPVKVKDTLGKAILILRRRGI